jgi:hypothetical protein
LRACRQSSSVTPPSLSPEQARGNGELSDQSTKSGLIKKASNIDIRGQRTSGPMSCAGETAEDQLCPETPLAVGIKPKLFCAEGSLDDDGASIAMTRHEENTIENVLKRLYELQGIFTDSEKRRAEEIMKLQELQGNFTDSEKRRAEEIMKLQELQGNFTDSEKRRAEETMKLQELQGNFTDSEKRRAKETMEFREESTKLREEFTKLRENVNALRVEVDLLTFDSALIYAGQLVSKVIGLGKNQSRSGRGGAFASAMRNRWNESHWGKNLVDLVETVFPGNTSRDDGTQLCFALGCDRVTTARNIYSRPEIEAYNDQKVEILIQSVQRYSCSQPPNIKKDVLGILRNHRTFLSARPCVDMRLRSGL